MRGLIALITTGLFAAIGLCADQPDWSRFRGPNGTGVANDQKPPVELGPERNVKWKVPVPSGLSSPIVAGENLVLTAFEGDKLYTIAYRRTDGAEVWRAQAAVKKIEPFMKAEGSPAASTPATDGKRIVTYFGSCGLICYDLAGKELWKLEMEPPTIPGGFGSGVSPILVDNTVVLVRDEMKNPRIIAVNADNGAPLWEKKRQSVVSYCTPTVWDTPAGKQVVAAGHGRLIAYDLKTGDEKWFVVGMPSGPTTSPVVAEGMVFYAGWSPGGADDKENQPPSFDDLLKKADANGDGVLSREEMAKAQMGDFFESLDSNKDGKVTRDEWDSMLKFFSEGKNTAFAVKSAGSGDMTKALHWKKEKGLPYIPSAIVYRGQIVMIKDGGLVSAYDAQTGKEIYVQERAAASGRYYASPVAANGNIYFTSLDEGAITVLKGGTAKPEVVAKNPKLGEKAAATPAIADNTLYLRTDKHLYAFAEKK